MKGSRILAAVLFFGTGFFVAIALTAQQCGEREFAGFFWALALLALVPAVVVPAHSGKK